MASEPIDKLLADIVGVQALDELMEPADVAGAYLFLTSRLADSITATPTALRKAASCH